MANGHPSDGCLRSGAAGMAYARHNDEAAPDETQWYFVADSVPALAWLANYGAVELNPWTSSVRDPREPTWALIDLDPGPNTSWDELLLLARLCRTALEHLGVIGQPKV